MAPERPPECPSMNHSLKDVASMIRPWKIRKGLRPKASVFYFFFSIFVLFCIFYHLPNGFYQVILKKDNDKMDKYIWKTTLNKTD